MKLEADGWTGCAILWEYAMLRLRLGGLGWIPIVAVIVIVVVMVMGPLNADIGKPQSLLRRSHRGLQMGPTFSFPR